MKVDPRRYRHEMLAGLILLAWLSLSFSTTEYLLHDSFDHQESKENERSQDDQEHTVAIKLNEAVQHSIQINVDFQSILLEEILQQKFVPTTLLRDQILNKINKNFRVLFRKIISPNAP